MPRGDSARSERAGDARSATGDELLALVHDADEAVLEALKHAGGRAALAVPLHRSGQPDLAVVRLVVPPLRDVV